LASLVFALWRGGKNAARFNARSFVRNPLLGKRRLKEVTALSILWIILIIVLVLALLGFFSRGRW
jgi:hypothetical protein